MNITNNYLLLKFLAKMSSVPNLLRGMLENAKLAIDGSNFSDWYLKLCIVLRLEDLLHVLDDPVPAPADLSKPTDAELESQKKWKEQEKMVQALILATVGDQLQRKFINVSARDIMAELTKLFTDSARKERYRTTMALTRCKMAEGDSVSLHFLRMQTHLEKLEKMKTPMPEELAEDVILGSLPASFKSFISMHHMREKAMSLSELHNALKTFEADNGKTKADPVLAVASSSKKVAKKSSKKKAAKAQSPLMGKSGGSSSKGNTKSSPGSNTECFYCHERGHFKMNCRKYKSDLDAGKIEKKRNKGVLVIELNLNLATSIQDWVLDTGSCAHLASNVQALRNRRSLRKGDVVLKVGNGAFISAVAVGSLDLHLPSGLILNLKDVYFVPSVFRNIISVSCLDTMDGFDFFVHNSCMVISKDNIFYANALVSNGLYVLDAKDDKQVLNVNNKRLKASPSMETLL